MKPAISTIYFKDEHISHSHPFCCPFSSLLTSQTSTLHVSGSKNY